MMNFFDFSEFPGLTRNARSTRAYDKWSHVCLRALDARQDAITQNVGGGSHEAAPRAPRTQRRTSTRKLASGSEDGDGDGAAPRFTIHTNPIDGMVVGSHALNTVFLLAMRYGGLPIVPIERVCEDCFAPLTLPNLRRKIASGDIPLPLVRMESDSKKAAQGVHLHDLADYIDKRRAAAVKECAQLAG